jgi:hypothetical protein
MGRAVAPHTGQGQRLVLDVREVRDRMRLRLLATLPALAGGAWLLFTADTLLLRVLALAGLVFAAIWLRSTRRTATQLTRVEDHYLDIGPDGLTLQAGPDSRSIAWSEIDAVEIDEDRLVVQLRLRSSGSLAVEPHYGALGLRELAETIERARADARP